MSTLSEFNAALLGLGTAATRDVGQAAGNVLELSGNYTASLGSSIDNQYGILRLYDVSQNGFSDMTFDDGTLTLQTATSGKFILQSPSSPTASVEFNGLNVTGQRGYALPDASGTIALLSQVGDRYLTSSTASNTVSNGAKTFTVGTGLAYTPTQDVTIAFNAGNHMHASVTSYNSTTGVLVVDVKQHTGSGTYAVWTVNVGGISSAVIPTGGTTGQVLSKASEANYDTVWSTLGNAATRDVGQAAGNLLELSSANQITIGDESAPSGSIIMTGLDGSVSISNDNGQLSFTDSEAGSILLNQIVVNNNVENNLVIGIDVNENPYLQGYSEVGLTSGSLLGFDETGGAKIVGNVNFSSGMVVFGTGASIPLSSNSSYMLATGSTGENAGFTANREDDTAFASFDMLEGASGSTGWSVQMAPGDNDLHIVDRVNSVDAITIVSGGNVGIGTTTPTETLDVNGKIKVSTDQYYPYTFETGSLQNTQGYNGLSIKNEEGISNIEVSTNGVVAFYGSEVFFSMGDRIDGGETTATTSGFYKYNGAFNIWSNVLGKNIASFGDNGNVAIGANNYGTYNGTNITATLYVDGDAQAKSFITTPVAITDLPSSPVAGMHAMVYDALAPVFLATVVSGGAVVAPVFYDGSGWKVG
jgi:hypothetical protein